MATKLTVSKKKPEKNPNGGRTPIYDSEYHPQYAKALAIEGLSNLEIAGKFGIVESTFYEWLNKYAEFSEALKEGKEPTNAKVEMALLRKAIGYETVETKVVTNENGEIIKTERIMREVPGDVRAQQLWLINRKCEGWSDKTVTEISGKDGGPVVLTVLKGVKLEDL